MVRGITLNDRPSPFPRPFLAEEEFFVVLGPWPNTYIDMGSLVCHPHTINIDAKMFYTRAQMTMLTIIISKEQVDFSNSSFHQEKNASTNSDKNADVGYNTEQSNTNENTDACQKEPNNSSNSSILE